MIEIKPCPCGNTPDELYVSEGSTFRWRYVECKCGWMIEARINTLRPHCEEQDYLECVDAWNAMPRLTLGEHRRKKKKAPELS